ncbi:hypothetical protein [Streptomyces sp. NPDC090445]|uniref:hypothetical protein n=1 Tax=Streptomyces sp. NPDC090445 TaxID=3365963 RepID=UPI0037FBDA34
MTMTEISRAGRRATAAAVLLCACAMLAAGCGTRPANGAAAAVPSGVPATGLCEPLDLTSDVAGPVYPPTDEETGQPQPQPPTEQETGPPQPTTEEQTGPPQPPTDDRTGVPEPPTDGDATPGAVPCGNAGWYDMTREFKAYQTGHRTADDPSVVVGQVRVRRVRDTGEALVVFATDSVGKGRGDDARALAQVFAAWRRQVYGDQGTVQLRTADGGFAANVAW